MAITHAMWVHGTSMKIEYPNRLKSVWKAGFYTRVVGKPNTTNWFHFHIPTVVIDDNKRQMIDSVMLRYRCRTHSAKIRDAHIYDGERKIVSHNNINISSTRFSFRRFNVPGKPDVRWGVGLSLGVSFNGTTDHSNTMEFSSAGCDFNLFETIRLHFKILTQPTISLDTMLQSMRDVYEPAGFRVVRASDETLNLPDLNTVDVGSCAGSTTDEQDDLFANRNNVGSNDIPVYFVQATNPPYNGCASSPSNARASIVASIASRWTLGHEIGHNLGLSHVSNNDRLMTGLGTNNITNPPPDLTSSEISTIRNSRYTQNP
jgi:hypothetical protein